MPGWVTPVAGGALVIGGVALAVGTIGEDVLTGGLGIADDAPTLGGAWAAITGGLAMVF